MDNLNSWLCTIYALDQPIQVQLLRSYTNDVYRVTTATGQCVLKVYGLDWRNEDDIQYEVALIHHLVNKGIRVANAISGKDGQKIYQLPTPKGEQYAVLFEYADGYKPQPPFSTDLYVAFGRAIGQMHNASDNFVTTYPRKMLDLTTIIDSPLKLALPLVKDEDERIFLEKVAKTITDNMHRLIADGLDWGPIHGDATLDNLHVTDDNQIILYDFDSGGHGWRAADLQGWAYNNDEYAEKWAAFKQGYASMHELKPNDLEAARYLAVAWLIWGLQIDLGNRVLAQGEAKVADYLSMQISAIRNQARLALG